MREHFDAKKRWRSAIASARALHRFGKHSRASSASSSGSGGWGRDHINSEVECAGSNVPSHDGSPTDASESFTKLSLGSSDPGTNINVKVTGPEEGETEEKGKAEVSSSADNSLTGASAAGLKDEADGDTTSSAQASSQVEESLGRLPEPERTEAVPAKDPSLDRVNMVHSQTMGSDESELRMPGTFHLSNAEKERSRRTERPAKWAETLRKFSLFS